MNQPTALGSTMSSRAATGAMTGAQYTAAATRVWIASVIVSGSQGREGDSPSAPSLRTRDRFQQPFGAMDDRVIDHAPVELDRGGAFRLRLPKRRDDALRLRDFFHGGAVAFVGVGDLIGMD